MRRKQFDGTVLQRAVMLAIKKGLPNRRRPKLALVKGGKDSSVKTRLAQPAKLAA